MRKSSPEFYPLSLLNAAPPPSSYDIFAINIASTMLGYVYNHTGALSTNQDLGVKVATPIGNLIGQLVFGWLADVVGRKRMCKSFPLVSARGNTPDIL